MPELISLDRKEFDGFLADYHAFVERSKKMLQKIDDLQHENNTLKEELHSTKTRLQSFEEQPDSGVQSDETLRKARETIANLIKETEKINAE
ncbi:MAG TPA: hypothetical protein VLV31_09440 [Candidatus Acidoferrales bacterium]|nr:hypothetical protein [Candidatus Acidoferrales bacterium]